MNKGFNDYEGYRKAKMIWEQNSQDGSYDIIEEDSEQELRMLETALSLRPGLYEQNPELKAMMESRIQEIRSKLSGGNWNGEV